MINQKAKSRQLELHEITAKIDKVDTKEEKLKLIKEYVWNYPAFHDYLRCLFDDRIQFLLPEGRPPYTPSSEAHPTTWNREHRKLKAIVKGMGDSINPIKREMTFIGILEGIHPDDSVMIADMISKRHSTTITKELVQEACPGMVQ